FLLVAAQPAASTSSAARPPERMPPSMLPPHRAAVSVPAQWRRLHGSRSARTLQYTRENTGECVAGRGIALQPELRLDSPGCHSIVVASLGGRRSTIGRIGGSLSSFSSPSRKSARFPPRLRYPLALPAECRAWSPPFSLASTKEGGNSRLAFTPGEGALP